MKQVDTSLQTLVASATRSEQACDGAGQAYATLRGAYCAGRLTALVSVHDQLLRTSLDGKSPDECRMEFEHILSRLFDDAVAARGVSP